MFERLSYIVIVVIVAIMCSGHSHHNIIFVVETGPLSVSDKVRVKMYFRSVEYFRSELDLTETYQDSYEGV